MHGEAAGMRGKHLLLKFQVKKFLGPVKSLSQSVGGKVMIGDVDKADSPACFDELLGDGFFLL